MKKFESTNSSVAFGYCPLVLSKDSDSFSITPVENFNEVVAAISDDPHVVDGWIYAGPQQHRDMMSGKVYEKPFSARVFGLPKTHVLTLKRQNSSSELDFLIWCLSFFTGMRFSASEAGFLDATPIKPNKLVDFVTTQDGLKKALEKSISYAISHALEPRHLKIVASVIHALFLAQYPLNLPFERFHYFYVAIDACYKLSISQENRKGRATPHDQRIRWMCDKYGIPLPDWAVSEQGIRSEISSVRNNAFHEGMFFDEPLGFEIYGGNQNSNSGVNVLLQMEKLICRLLVAILIDEDVTYVHTPVDNRHMHGLEL